MTFKDLEELLSNKAYRSSIGHLLADWYDYEVIADVNSVVVQSRDGDHVDLLELHRRIQWDESKQREIYEAAMALWR